MVCRQARSLCASPEATLIYISRWIAALWGVMKTEWESYYQKEDPDKDDGLLLVPTEKGKPYDDAMMQVAFGLGLNFTPWPLGDIDGRAAHWLMTVILRRNIVVSRESSHLT